MLCCCFSFVLLLLLSFVVLWLLPQLSKDPRAFRRKVKEVVEISQALFGKDSRTSIKNDHCPGCSCPSCGSSCDRGKSCMFTCFCDQMSDNVDDAADSYVSDEPEEEGEGEEEEEGEEGEVGGGQDD